MRRAFRARLHDLDPTLTIYEASRDLMRARRAEWHEEYTLPSLWRFLRSRTGRFARLLLVLIGRPKMRSPGRSNYRPLDAVFSMSTRTIGGGRVTTGSAIRALSTTLYGFGYIRELELLQRGGISPARGLPRGDLGRSRSCWARDHEIGSALSPVSWRIWWSFGENPLEPTLKVLYGTGAVRVNARRTRPVRGEARRRRLPGRSRTGSSTTRRPCAPTSAAWSRRRSCAKPAPPAPRPAGDRDALHSPPVATKRRRRRPVSRLRPSPHLRPEQPRVLHACRGSGQPLARHRHALSVRAGLEHERRLVRQPRQHPR